jgi:hypothetical protein
MIVFMADLRGLLSSSLCSSSFYIKLITSKYTHVYLITVRMFELVVGNRSVFIGSMKRSYAAIRCHVKEIETDFFYLVAY